MRIQRSYIIAPLMAAVAAAIAVAPVAAAGPGGPAVCAGGQVAGSDNCVAPGSETPAGPLKDNRGASAPWNPRAPWLGAQ